MSTATDQPPMTFERIPGTKERPAYFLHGSEQFETVDVVPVAERDSARASLAEAVALLREIASEPEPFDVAISTENKIIAFLSRLDGGSALTREHDALCHSDGSTCKDGCDVGPIRQDGAR